MTEIPTRPRMDHGATFWRWAWLVVIFVWPLFAHGCHGGDHDDELAVGNVESGRVQEVENRSGERGAKAP